MRKMRYHNFIIHIALTAVLLMALVLPSPRIPEHFALRGVQKLTAAGCAEREIAQNRLRETENEGIEEENAAFTGARRLLRTGMPSGGILPAAGYFVFCGELLRQIVRRLAISDRIYHMRGICYHIRYMEATDGEKD